MMLQRMNLTPLNLMALALMLVFSLSAKAQQKWNGAAQVELDKAYQQVLFYYFQGDFFNALTHFSILQSKYPNQLSKITTPGVEPELLKGGISLAQGMESQATAIFARVLNTSSYITTQTQAWFLLGKALYQKQLYAEAANALANINTRQAQDNLDNLSRDELIYLKSQLFAWHKQADHVDTNWLAQLSGESIYRDYVIYNQGLAALQQGKLESAISSLSNMGEPAKGLMGGSLSSWMSPFQQSDDEEVLALRDRANLTLGYSYLQNEKPAEAATAFQLVRVDSLDTQAALLGYGWAASRQDDYSLAISVWKRLLEQSHSTEYVLEAYLASAYAYEKAFAPKQALQQLQLGLKRLADEKVTLEHAKQQIADDFFISLVQPFNEQNKTPAEFAHLLIAQDVRVQLAQLGELFRTEKQFETWQTRLDTFHLMLDERERAAGERALHLKQSAFLSRLGVLQSQRDQLSAKLEQANKNVMLLLNEQEAAWQTRLQKAQQRFTDIEHLKELAAQKPLSPAYQQRLKRITGRMLWHATDVFPERLWGAKKALIELDDVLVKAKAQQDTLTARLNSKPDYSQQRQRIDDIAQHLQKQRTNTDVLMEKQLSALKQLFMEKIDQQIALIQGYQLQAQLAVVRLHDEAYRKAQTQTRQGDSSNGG